MEPVVRFLQLESASGIILLIMTVAALLLANSPWSKEFLHFWEVEIGLVAGSQDWAKPLHFWINDLLMAIFFLVAGLEIKRELVTGEFRDPKKALLPILAALGGMLVPGAIYISLRHGQAGQEGWGIPIATDIAFVVGFLSLLGSRVPLGLKILLLALAIADDIGAIIVVALFYSGKIAFIWLGLGMVGLLAIHLIGRAGVRSWLPYLALGLAIWWAFSQSGVHPAVAGVLLGLLASTRKSSSSELKGNGETANGSSTLEDLEDRLHPWVAYLIMPLFAFSNAGVALDFHSITHPVALSVALSLLMGKPAGIFLFTWVGVKLGLVRLPTGVNWKILAGGGILGGIGFTMSLFIAGLALEGDLLSAGKIGTLAGSLLSALLGCLWLFFALPKSPSGVGK